MVNALKRMDKKFLIIAGIIVMLPIFIIVFLAIIQGCGNKKVSYEEYEKKMLSAGKKYIENTDKLPKNEAETYVVKLSTLISEGYIKTTEDLIEDSSCEGSVIVRRNGSSIEETNGGFLNYTVNLECDNHSTITLSKKIKEDLVTSGSGLYQDGNLYVFKGDKPNNYINFLGYNYRIMSMDENGILRLIKIDAEATNRLWDNKYNIETSSFNGINIYKDSIMKEYLENYYKDVKKIKTKAKERIVAYDVCIGKRSALDYSISSDIDCAEKIEKQLVSLVNVSDYARASLDENCTNLRSRSCINYNYLSKILSSTWTLNASADNTYEVIYLSQGLMETQNANLYNEFNVVIHIDGNELYVEGKGSKDKPYILN